MDNSDVPEEESAVFDGHSSFLSKGELVIENNNDFLCRLGGEQWVTIQSN